MKKLILLLVLIFPVVFLTAQTVDRIMVVQENATGTWWGYCPGAATGAADLLENNHNVAVIENHNGDSYANTYSNARNSYYGITGYPTAKFDGIITKSGGIPCPDPSGLYNEYAGYVATRNAVGSPFNLELYGSNTSGSSYDITIIIK